MVRRRGPEVVGPLEDTGLVAVDLQEDTVRWEPLRGRLRRMRVEDTGLPGAEPVRDIVPAGAAPQAGSVRIVAELPGRMAVDRS